MENPSKHIGILQHYGCEACGPIADALERAGTCQHSIRSLEGNSVPYEIGSTIINLDAHTHLPQLQKIGRPVFARWAALL